MNDSGLFRDVFHEAHVVDLDFSKWDRFIRLVVVARALRSETGRFRMLNIDFGDVEAFSLDFSHRGLSPSQGGHCQWVVMDSIIEHDSTLYHIALWGPSPAPRLRIACKEFRFSELSPELIDATNPRWNAPYAGLARLSLEDLYKQRLG